jgi:uncharacterized repeat protein (TIGR03803 family)
MTALRFPTVSIFRSPKISITSSLIILALAVFCLPPAQAEQFRILYSFPRDFANGLPYAGLLLDSSGNLYGTAAGSFCFEPTNGYGSVFEINSSGSEMALHSFDSTDGACPFDSVIEDGAGNLYGTTFDGGAYGTGNVFKLDASGVETSLYSFSPGQSGNADGCYPYAKLLRDQTGNLYGTASNCGASGFGMIFKIDPSGNEIVLHNFSGGVSDGGSPYGGLIMDAAGNLYGTTARGGSASTGVLYKLSPKGKLTILHSFNGGNYDGCAPVGTPLMDKAGNLYGTTPGCGSFHSGAAWKVGRDGTETVLHNFAGGASDGAVPSDAGLIFDADGNLYGVTSGGGVSNYGTVYQLAQDGTLTLLHVFRALSSEFGAQDPQGSLIMDSNGNLYGTTVLGGSGGGNGTVWKLIR